MDRDNVLQVLAEVRLARRLYCVGQYAAAEAALDRAEDTLAFAETPETPPDVEPSLWREALVMLGVACFGVAATWGACEVVSWLYGM